MSEQGRLNEHTSTLTAVELAAIIDEPLAAFSAGLLRSIEQTDLSYTSLEGADRDGVLIEVLKQLDAPLSVSGPARQDDWERNWSDNLRDFRKERTPDQLVPRYFRGKQVLRYRGKFIREVNPGLLQRFHRLYCRMLFERCLSAVDRVWEFGCGTGHNLSALSELFPEKDLIGLDWSRSAVELVSELSARNPRIRGQLFDMFHPSAGVSFGPNDAVITVHGLEQLGRDHAAFLDFLLRHRPALCMHIEPVIELYRDDERLDQLAISYHRKRGYLEGYLTALRDLESKGRVEIIKVKRSGFGSMLDEGYSLLLWRPRLS